MVWMFLMGEPLNGLLLSTNLSKIVSMTIYNPANLKLWCSRCCCWFFTLHWYPLMFHRNSEICLQCWCALGSLIIGPNAKCLSKFNLLIWNILSIQPKSGYRLYDSITCNRIVVGLCKSYIPRNHCTNIPITSFTDDIRPCWNRVSTWQSAGFRLDSRLWVSYPQQAAIDFGLNFG